MDNVLIGLVLFCHNSFLGTHFFYFYYGEDADALET